MSLLDLTMGQPGVLTARPSAKEVATDIVPPAETYVNNLTLLFQLNRLDGGLSEQQLSMILCKCCACGKIFTKHMFYTYHSHTCPPSS